MTIYLCLSRILRALGMSFSFLFPIWPEGATQEWTAAEQLMWNVPTGEVENRYSTIRDAKKNPWFCRTGRVSSKKGVNLRKSYEIVWFVTIPSPQAKVRQSSWILWSCCQQSRRRCHGGWTKTIQSMMQRWWLLEERLESINFMWILFLHCNLQDVLGFASGRICVDDFPVWVWTSVYFPIQITCFFVWLFWFNAELSIFIQLPQLLAVASEAELWQHLRSKLVSQRQGIFFSPVGRRTLQQTL